MDYRSEPARDWLQRHSGLDEIVVDALLDVGVRPRTVIVDDGLLISLRGVNLNPDANVADMVAVEYNWDQAAPGPWPPAVEQSTRARAHGRLQSRNSRAPSDTMVAWVS